METTSILLIAGFVICFILLFVFIAKYHGALEDETDLERVEGLNQVTIGQEPTFQPRAALLQSTQAPAALEVADLKEQVKTLHYQLQEFKATTQKHESDMAKQLARLETRIATFEQEYVNKLQPTLLRVIDELEHLKGSEDIVASAQEEASTKEDEEIPA
ncbi:MAG: hypothetical protein II913_03615 [Elusimicrobiaceae bacterium]|jgi:molecular chaperone GrpE (heat shock protein)|nr:hypothetical protein [Elusimicrobiaceae bacterium]